MLHEANGDFNVATLMTRRRREVMKGFEGGKGHWAKMVGQGQGLLRHGMEERRTRREMGWTMMSGC